MGNPFSNPSPMLCGLFIDAMWRKWQAENPCLAGDAIVPEQVKTPAGTEELQDCREQPAP